MNTINYVEKDFTLHRFKSLKKNIGSLSSYLLDFDITCEIVNHPSAKDDIKQLLLYTEKVYGILSNIENTKYIDFFFKNKEINDEKYIESHSEYYDSNDENDYNKKLQEKLQKQLEEKKLQEKKLQEKKLQEEKLQESKLQEEKLQETKKIKIENENIENLFMRENRNFNKITGILDSKDAEIWSPKSKELFLLPKKYTIPKIKNVIETKEAWQSKEASQIKNSKFKYKNINLLNKTNEELHNLKLNDLHERNFAVLDKFILKEGTFDIFEVNKNLQIYIKKKALNDFRKLEDIYPIVRDYIYNNMHTGADGYFYRYDEKNQFYYPAVNASGFIYKWNTNLEENKNSIKKFYNEKF